MYALTPDDGSAAREVAESSVEHFKDIAVLSDSDAARVINADGIHVLISLTPYLRGDRGGILALRPAPVQAHYLGFPASVGDGLADYIITDAFVSPRSHESQYTEKLMQLPGCFYLADYRTLSAEILEEDELPSRADLGLPRNAFIVACFNPPATLSPGFWDVCCDVLRSIKRAVLCVGGKPTPACAPAGPRPPHHACAPTFLPLFFPQLARALVPHRGAQSAGAGGGARREPRPDPFLRAGPPQRTLAAVPRGGPGP